MLQKLRSGVGTIFAKLLLGLLILSFAVWGIGDQVAGIGQGTLASVGNIEITPQRFQTAYRNELQRLSQRMGRRLTPDEARMFGLERQVLSQLMGSAAMDNHAGDLDLGLSDETIAKMIHSDRSFQDSEGNFSRIAFDSVLSRIDMSEGAFIANQKTSQIRQQLTNALTADVVPPAPMVQAMYKYSNEARVVKFFTLDRKAQGKVDDPSDAILKVYFEQNKSQFMTPEFRKVQLLSITRDEAAKRVPLTDEEMRVAYKETKASYDVAEKRHVQQITFPDKAAADKAYAKLRDADDAAEELDKLGFKKTDYDLGEQTMDSMVDTRAAKAAFKLPEDEFSKPVEGTYSTVILRVTKITKGKESTFDGVKKQVRARLSRELSNKQLQKLFEQVDEQRGGGKTLKESADALKLTYLDIDAIDRNGQTGKGKSASPLPDIAKVATGIFAGEVGVENDVVELADGGYAWFDIVGQTAAKQKPFKEVRDDIKAIVIDLESRKKIARIAREIVEKLATGGDFDKTAKDLKLDVTTTKPIKRTVTQKGLSQAAMRRAFTLRLKASASAQAVDGATRSILTVTGIKEPPAPTPDELKALKASLARQMTGDVFTEYVSALRKSYGEDVNNNVFLRATGQETGQGGGGGRGSGLF